MPLLILIIKGFVAVCCQTIVLRELLSVFFGNEFSVALVLVFWVFGGAVGSVVFRRRCGTSRRYLLLTVIQGVALPLVLLGAHSARHLFAFMPGESLSLGIFLLLNTGIAFLAGFLEGGRFVLSSVFFPPSSVGGKMYGWEGIGGLAGGLVLSLFLMSGAPAVPLLAGLGLLNLLPLLAVTTMRTAAGWAVVGMALLFAVSCPADREVTRRSRLPFRFERVIPSVYGNLAIISRQGERVLVRNGMPEFSDQPDAFPNKNIVFFSLAFAKKRECIAIVGKPELLVECVRYPVRRIVFVDRDPAYIAAIKEFYPSLNGRVEWIVQDPYRYFRSGDPQFDVVILGELSPLTFEENRLLGERFLSGLVRSLRKGGVVACSLPGSADYIGEDLVALHAVSRQAFIRFFPQSRIIFSYPFVYLFSRDADLSGMPDSSSSPDATLFSHSYCADVCSARREEEFLVLLRSHQFPENTDFSPTAVYYGLAAWFARLSPEAGRRAFAAVVGLMRMRDHAFFLFLLPIPVLCFFRGRRSRLLVIGLINGLLGLGMEVLLLFLFQREFGSLFSLIGCFLGCFMAGLAVGALLPSDTVNAGGRFITAELFHTFFYGAALLLLFVAQRVSPFLLLPVLFGTGFFIGWEFGLLARLLKNGPGAEALGMISAFDCAGAVAGGVLVPFFFLPVMGFVGAFLLLFVLRAVACFMGTGFRVRGSGFR